MKEVNLNSNNEHLLKLIDFYNTLNVEFIENNIEVILTQYIGQN